MVAEEKIIFDENDAVKSGFQGVQVVEGIVTASGKDKDKEGRTTWRIILSPAAIVAAEDATMVGPRDEFVVQYYPKNTENSTWVKGVIPAFKKAGIPLPDGPVGKRVQLTRTEIDLGGTITRKGPDGKPVIGPDGKPVKDAMRGSAFVPTNVGEGKVEISDALAKKLAALAVKAKTAEMFKRNAMLDKDVAAAGLKSAAASGALLEALVENGTIKRSEDGTLGA